MTIFFTDRAGSANAFHKLELGRGIITFTEFDFTFFWEHSIEAGKVAKKTGQLPKQTVGNAKSAVVKCHPYLSAAQNTDYAHIVLDCIIDYILSSERMTEDELWMRCISSKIPYENAIFTRLSDYKTFRGINQWKAVSGLQKYARRKADFIFGSIPGEAAIDERTAYLRKCYFDLAFSVAENECRTPKRLMPSVRLTNMCLSPSAVFTVNNSVTKSIYRRFAEKLEKVPDFSHYVSQNNEFLYDKIALEAFSFIEEAERPMEPDMNLFAAAVSSLPEEVYILESLKSAIDLEFDLMFDTGVYLKRCETCGRYFLVDRDGFGVRFCDRVGTNGKTCRETFDNLRGSIAELIKPQPQMPEPEMQPETQIQPPVSEKPQKPPENTAEVPQKFTEAPLPSEKPEYIVDKKEYIPELDEVVEIRYGAPKREFEPSEVPEVLERRAQKLYNALYKRTGKGITESEFREWSQYLSNMKRNIKVGEGSAKQLEDFLDYTDKMFAEIKRSLREHIPMRREPVERLTRFAGLTDNMHNMRGAKFPEYEEAPLPPVVIPIETVEGSEETVEIDGRKAKLTKPKWEVLK
ncbi:MAG: DUF6076 domain-containing protein [Ruminococcus sp.]|nr:DUF6076 domain-containing protein [Ruminococcus sp.]